MLQSSSSSIIAQSQLQTTTRASSPPQPSPRLSPRRFMPRHTLSCTRRRAPMVSLSLKLSLFHATSLRSRAPCQVTSLPPRLCLATWTPQARPLPPVPTRSLLSRFAMHALKSPRLSLQALFSQLQPRLKPLSQLALLLLLVPPQPLLASLEQLRSLVSLLLPDLSAPFQAVPRPLPVRLVRVSPLSSRLQ